MPAGRLKPITHGTFRSSRRYRLVHRGQVPPHFQSVAEALADEPDFFGLLIARSPKEDATKAVCLDTARLFDALRKPGGLPTRVIEPLGARANEVIAKLVLDGVLELQQGSDFVSGPKAFIHLFPEPPEYSLCGPVGDLTMQALRSAEHMLGAGHGRLASYLYRYNTAPASPRWRSRLPNRQSVLDHLSTPLVPWTRTAVHRTWTLAEGLDPGSRWIVWKRTGIGADPAEFRRLTTHKLYVSPTCDSLRDALHSTIPVLTDSRAFAFKVGSDLPGLLRPDKLVAYFAHHEDLSSAAARLHTALERCPAQGVPFTAALPGDGLLSWGMDPAEDAQTFGWKGGESWRLWVSNRLAESLFAASRCRDLPVAPWTFALAALELMGIQPTTFVPAEYARAAARGPFRERR